MNTLISLGKTGKENSCHFYFFLCKKNYLDFLFFFHLNNKIFFKYLDIFVQAKNDQRPDLKRRNYSLDNLII